MNNNTNEASTEALQALSLFEARERIADTTFVLDDEARPDGWPERHRDFPEPAAVTPSEDNSLRHVLFEAGLVLAVPLALAALFTILLQP